jgi:hypothetical protein
MLSDNLKSIGEWIVVLLIVLAAANAIIHRNDTTEPELPTYGAVCHDGGVTDSFGSGTCSWHGGVWRWIDGGKVLCPGWHHDDPATDEDTACPTPTSLFRY